MGSRFCLVFVVFYFTVVSIFTVHLRGLNNRIFYRLCVQKAEQSRLKQELGNKQLRLENLISPPAVSHRLGDEPQLDR